MTVRRKTSYVGGLGLLAALVLILTSDSQTVSTRTHNIGADRIVGVQSLSEPNGDVDACQTPDDMQAEQFRAYMQQGRIQLAQGRGAGTVVAQTAQASPSRTTTNIDKKPLKSSAAR